MLLGTIPERNAKLYPDHLALLDGEAAFSFAQMDQRVNRLANAICARGYDHGDRIAVLHENCFQYIELYFAAAKAGLPLVPLNYRLSQQELAYILQDSGARALFFGGKFRPLVEGLRRDAPQLTSYVCMDQNLDDALHYEDLLAAAPSRKPEVRVDESDIAVLGYTGGTTGLPKGVMTTHRNIISSCYNTALERKLRPGLAFLNVPPLFHAADTNSMFTFSFMGGSNVLVRSFDPDLILRQIQQHRITHLLLVPAMILRMLDHPNFGQYDLGSLQVIYYGTAPMPVEPLRKAMAAFKCGFSQTYGTTETFVPITILQPEDHLPNGNQEQVRRLASAGRAVIGVQVKVVDATGAEAAPNQVGEIAVKGDNVMKGYWNKPALTAEVLRDGWYFTGDMGRMDELGYLFVVDRKKDMIISGGENIYPTEIENILFRHPAVADAAVIGVPDENWGEAVKALVVLKQGATASEPELIEFCKSMLASFKKPRSVSFVSELPRSAAGKLLKRELRERYWKGRERII